MYLPSILILIFIILVLASCYPMQESYISYRRSYSRIQQGAQINHEIQQIDEKIEDYESSDNPSDYIVQIAKLNEQKEKLIEQKRQLRLPDNSSSSYNPGELDITYHESPEEIMEDDELGYFEGPSRILLADDTMFDHKQASKDRHKSSDFMPTYEDSVFLSRLSDLSHSKPIYDSASILAGFCHFHQMDPMATESKCNSLDKNVCASTDCCVLLGGNKCVAGSKGGPYNKSHYSDPQLSKKDHYYFKGKCYGNCRAVV